MVLSYFRVVEESLFVAAQWTGRPGDLSDIRAIGFDLQAEEGQRTGNKALIVYDPTHIEYDSITIKIGEWALRYTERNQLRVLSNNGMMDLIALISADDQIIIRS